jgi:hypothetical protein
MTDDGVRTMLRELEELERELSAERRRLQDRIDFVRGGGAYAGGEIESDRLRQLEERERELSTRRRSLQRQIDAARHRPR